ncbi:nuclear transport factor 2 family protein [Myxococcota bacterium]|nr:nuclear transport factor 2 family protein [Myxococcota bacterium]
MADRNSLEHRIDQLEKRLQVAEDVNAISQLKAHYGELTDARYHVPDSPDREVQLSALAERITTLFSPDAIWDGGPGLGICEGRAAIRERFEQPAMRFAQHFFVKPRIAIDGDRATGRWDILAPCTSLKGRPYWMAGVEDDEYVRLDGVWLHSRMKLDLIFMAPYEDGWARV